MNKKLAQKSVKAALSGDWQLAVEINERLLQYDPEDIATLNRLANAYAGCEDFKKAVKITEKVLKIDPENAIAKRTLEKLKHLENGQSTIKQPASPTEFIEEPGKTKVIPLINSGDETVLKMLAPAEKVEIKAHNHKVCVYSIDGKYVGRLPDDIAASLKVMIELGNEYNTYIKRIQNNTVTVFIRETSRCEKLKNFPSFSSDKINLITLKNSSK